MQESDNKKMYHTINSDTDKWNDIAAKLNDILLNPRTVKTIRKHFTDEQYRTKRGEEHD